MPGLRDQSAFLRITCLGDHNAPRSINAMDLKNVLGWIEPNGRDG
jgi:hypothetical protein